MLRTPKRILFVSHTAGITGPTQSLIALLPYLKQTYDVSVLVPEIGQLWQWLAKEGLPVFSLPDQNSRGISKIAGLLRKEKFDLVYGNNPSTYSRNAMIAARWIGRPFVWHFRSVKGHWGWRDGIFLRFASRVIAVSKACAEPLLRFIPENKICVIYNGVDAAKFQQDHRQARRFLIEQARLPEDAKILISVGHLRSGKGQAEQVEIMRQLLPSQHNLHLLLIGSVMSDPAYVTAMQAQISQYKLTDRIHFLGIRDDVHRLLAGADIYIHTSKQEAHPRSIIEAMAAGLPVIAFSVGGVPETVIDGQSGCLVEYRDCAGMSRAIQSLLDNPQIAAKFGDQAQRRVQQHYTAAGTASQIDHVLQELLMERRN